MKYVSAGVVGALVMATMSGVHAEGRGAATMEAMPLEPPSPPPVIERAISDPVAPARAATVATPPPPTQAGSTSIGIERYCPPGAYCPPAGGGGGGTNPHEAEGRTIVADLSRRYDETIPDCQKRGGSTPLPALLCSGVLMRVTRRGTGYDAWNPNPASRHPNGVSFSWFRKDALVATLAFDLSNGFILMPYFKADGIRMANGSPLVQLTVLCVFPFDAATDSRRSAESDGCGAMPGYAGTEPCQDPVAGRPAIIEDRAWLARFGSVPAGGRYANQCAFRLTSGSLNATLAFFGTTRIRNALRADSSRYQNEVMVSPWKIGDTNVPVEAFFYTNRNSSGRKEAMDNQGDFFARTGRWVPVVAASITPDNRSGAAAAGTTSSTVPKATYTSDNRSGYPAGAITPDSRFGTLAASFSYFVEDQTIP